MAGFKHTLCEEAAKCVTCSPPRSPAVLLSTVVLATRRVLLVTTKMPPPESPAALLATREPWTLTLTRSDPYIPPAQSAASLIMTGSQHMSCVSDSPKFAASLPPRLPPVLCAAVVLSTRRLLFITTCMPPPWILAVLRTMCEFSTLSCTRVCTAIPPAQSATKRAPTSSN